MHLLEEAILIGFAGWRIASMLTAESGPADIFEKMRNRVGLDTGEVSGFFPTVFSCVYCMSVYTCLIFFLIWQIEPIIVMIVAAMTIALMAHKVAKVDG